MALLKTYDYIITGGGASGLLLALRFAEDVFFENKSVLLIDASKKDKNDRTWCFWSTDSEYLKDVISYRWENVTFCSNDLNKTETIQPYTYNKIKGLEFYNYARKQLAKKSNITLLHAKVLSVTDTGNKAEVSTTTGNYYAKQVFNSVLFSDKHEKDQQFPIIYQHFVGWVVKTNKDVFDPSTATFMDFDIPQNSNTRFMYVLPTHKNEALLEYTLFSRSVLNPEVYKTGIKEYLESLGVDEYEILEKEVGCIPMTCYPFWEMNTKHIHHIGIAGGWTKASTGYTFRNSIIRTQTIVSQLKQNQKIQTKKRDRYWFYDLLLLDILNKQNAVGSMLFSDMFRNNSFQEIFAFLDEETSLWQDLKTIWSMPKGIFIRALWRRISGRN